MREINNMKVYKEYKEIEIKDIKGVKANEICSKNLEKVFRYMEVIKKEGIKKPFEVIQKENGYYVLDGGIKLMAAKMLGYDKIPCLIRDIKQEILLRKINKIYKIECNLFYIKSDINDEDGLKFHRKNYYKLNNL